MRRTNQKFQQQIPTSIPISKQTVLAPATPQQTPKQTPHQTPVQTPVSKPIQEEEIKFIDNNAEEIKMDVEEKKEDVNLDEIQEDEKVVNLDEGKKGKHKEKKEYDLDDSVIRDITLAGDIHVRLVANTNGYFVDIRKYFKGYPTKKGIRMLATKFATASEMLRNDLKELLPK